MAGFPGRLTDVCPKEGTCASVAMLSLLHGLLVTGLYSKGRAWTLWEIA